LTLIVPGGVTPSSDLSAATSSVLRTTEDLPALLAAAYRAFECALQALRDAEDRAGPLLPALVLAAAEAADGRDAVAAAGPFPGPGAALAETVTSLAAIDVADQVAGLSLALFTRLRDAAAGGGGSACAAAAARAGRMYELLAPPG
jgi:Flp pilus assembly protein CpaB